MVLSESGHSDTVDSVHMVNNNIHCQALAHVTTNLMTKQLRRNLCFGKMKVSFLDTFSLRNIVSGQPVT